MTPGWSMISAQTRFSRLSRGKTGRFSRRNHARIRGLGRDGFSKKSHTALETRTRKQPRMETVRLQSDCCVSGVRGAGVVERRNDAIETSIDRFGGDYKSFDLKSGDGDDACKAACAADNKCRAWTYARPGYAGKEAHCFLKKDIKPPRRKAGFTSGVVR